MEMKTKCLECGSKIELTGEAKVCPHGCTYCVSCAEDKHKNACRECGGELTLRPQLEPAILEYYKISNAEVSERMDLHSDLKAIVHEDWEHLPAYPGKDSSMSGSQFYTMMLGGAKQSMPDYKAEIIKVLYQKNYAYCTVISNISATPQGKFMGSETNGKRFEIQCIDVHFLADGKIKKTYHSEDWGSAMMQVKKMEA